MTRQQWAVLSALRARPDYWITEPGDLAEATGMTPRGVLVTLYHLSDMRLVEYSDWGWKPVPVAS